MYFATEEAREDSIVPLYLEEFLLVLANLGQHVTRIKIGEVLPEINIFWLVVAVLFDSSILEVPKLQQN